MRAWLSVLQLRNEGPQSLPSMTQGVLLCGIQLRGGAIEAARDEYGVISEASQAPGVADQRALPGAAGDYGFRIRGCLDKGDDALIAGRPLPRQNVAQLAEHFAEVVMVAGALAGVTRGVDARTSAQGVYYDSRVVGQ
jgi:hypothetical protein